MDTLFEQSPTKAINTEHLFGIKCSFKVFGFEKRNDHVPEIDETYKFDPETTLSILAGFSKKYGFFSIPIPFLFNLTFIIMLFPFCYSNLDFCFSFSKI